MKKIDFINERSDYSKQILNKIPSFYLRFGNIFLFIFLITIKRINTQMSNIPS